MRAVGFEQIVGAFDGEVRGLNRHKQVSGGDQRVDGENAEGGRRIENHEIVIFQDGRERVFQFIRGVKLAGELLFEASQRQTCRAP